MKPGSLRAAFALMLALCAGAAPAKAPAGPHPALWELADADTTIYLFGTVHALPANYPWQDDRLRAAVAGSDRLVIEALLDPDPAVSAALLLRMGTAPGLPPLAARVKPRERAKLARLIAASGAPPAMLDGMKSWAAALILSTDAIAKLAVTQDDGVEAKLKAMFAAAHKPVEGLETTATQLGFFDTLPEKDQRAFLAGVIDEPQDDKPEFDRMLAAWTRGDEQAIARTFAKEMKDVPGLDAALLAHRNATWAETLIARLAQPGTILVAVGAGHLAGSESVQAMLAKRGYRVERLQ